VNIENEIMRIITTIRKHQGIREDEFGLDSALYENGIGLDSLCVAELSAMLEKAYGNDPYTAGSFPHTIRDIIDFYS
jgi:acyl carrier protein